MNELIIKEIAQNLGIKEKQVITVVTLLAEDNTVPFIARYRKEATGGLDEDQINAINNEWVYQNNLFQRKEDVIRLIDEKGMLTPELKAEILKATKLVEVEDLYRPFKEKKKTKATEAIKQGLKPFAEWLLTYPNSDVLKEAEKYVNIKVEAPAKPCKNVDEVIQGAKYIIAEIVSDKPEYRKDLREILYDGGIINSVKKKDAEDEKLVYENYYDYQEPVNKIKPHRVLAINRAEKEKVITVSIKIDQEIMFDYLKKNFIKNYDSTATPYIIEAIDDSLKRLIYPSIEREIRAELTETSEEQAINVFSINLQKLLLQPPLKGKMVLGVDPAFRTGCKLAIVDREGKVLGIDVIYPIIHGDEKIQEAKTKVIKIINQYGIELISIGNGTASRETEKFIAGLLKEAGLKNTKYVIVNEAGASVYSAGPEAQREFPDLSVEQRSAASIARRLQDPLSELVKIDPKSIGVGQYQHDVTQKKLSESLNFVVTQAVNQVGVNVNTASQALLMYVSGLNKKTADAIVRQREENGKFNNRKDLLKVSSLGGKTYEQAIGFLRITDGDEVLDMTSIHPESYDVAKKIMARFNITKDMLGKPEISDIFDGINKENIASEMGIDKYTFSDIIDAFIAPLRDPRDEFPQPILKSDILTLADLKIGMELEGTVRNVVDFGAFIDIGLHEDGLLHISKIAKRYIKHPSDVLHVGDIVKVYVLNIDEKKEKVGLTMDKDFINQE